MIYLIALGIALGLTALVLGVLLLIREYIIRRMQEIFDLTRKEAVELYEQMVEKEKGALPYRAGTGDQ